MDTPTWTFAYKAKGKLVKFYVGWSREFIDSIVLNHNRMFGPAEDYGNICYRCGSTHISPAKLKFRVFHVWCCREKNLIYTDVVTNDEVYKICMLKCEECDKDHYIIGKIVDSRSYSLQTQVLFIQHEAKKLGGIVPQVIPAPVDDDSVKEEGAPVGKLAFTPVYDNQ